MTRICFTVCLGLLAGCGPVGTPTFGVKPEVPPPDRAQVIAEALAKTTGPVILIEIPRSAQIAAAVPVGRNGDHVTWGTADRRSLTTHHGVITATRGLGQDLMSSDISEPFLTIQTGVSRQATRVHRFLSPEYAEIDHPIDCRVEFRAVQTPKGNRTGPRVGAMTETGTGHSTGTGPSTGTRIVPKVRPAIGDSAAKIPKTSTGTETLIHEYCRRAGADFTNSYRMDYNGRIIGAAQWLTPGLSRVIITQLRP